MNESGHPELEPEEPRTKSAEREPEDKRIMRPVWHAWSLTAYYLLFFVFLFWFALDIWTLDLGFFERIGFPSIRTKILDSQAGPISLAEFYVVSYTLIGGAIGSILYSIRLFFSYYAGRNRKAYSRRWFGKYITAPWEGAAMAMVVASLLKGGVAVFGTVDNASQDVGANSFAAFAIGTLVGFGMREVVGWLHKVTRTMFGDPHRSTVSHELGDPAAPIK